MAVIIH